MTKSLRAGLSVSLCAAILAGVPVPGPSQGDPSRPVHSEVTLASTVLTLEGGIVGLQHLLHFTPLQLQGDLCAQPNRCEPVDYFAMPLGPALNDLGAATLNEAIDGLPDGAGSITLFGHSQGGQVIYSALRGWAAKPQTAPDPAQLSWVSIGNPENAFGGRSQIALPPNSPYRGIEVIRQYDGWADWPTGPFNLVAWANAVVGMSTTHVFGYFDVDLDAADNIRYTPEKADGTAGNITYVFVPNHTLPLVAMTGVLAPLLNPVLDPILRPMVEAGYDRPIGAVVSGVNSAGVQAPGASRANVARAAATTEPTADRGSSVHPSRHVRQPAAAASERVRRPM